MAVSVVLRRYAVAAASALLLSMVVIAALLFVAPLRDKFFNANVWPWRLPSDISEEQIKTMKRLALPGDVIVESNMHYWQWVALSRITTGSSWVHTSIVDYDGKLLTMDTTDVKVPFSIFLKWESTRLALVRPKYSSEHSRRRGIDWARSKLGTRYDPSFKNPAGSCTGLVGTALRYSEINVAQTTVSGRRIYAADAFFHMPGSLVIWTSR